jgi:hypothetical protein
MKKLFFTISILFFLSCSNDDAQAVAENTCEITVFGIGTSFPSEGGINYSVTIGTTMEEQYLLQVDQTTYQHYSALFDAPDRTFVCWTGTIED